MNYKLYSLGELISNKGEAEASSVISNFICSKDPDRENYLHKDAIMMEKKALSRTYLAMFDDDCVAGYFSVGMRCMGVPNAIPISTNLRKKLNVDSRTQVAQMYLLGQLARSDQSEPGIGVRLLDDALDVIHRAFVAVGCRAVRVDCTDDLVDYYRKHGFTFINKRDGDDLNQLVTILE